MWSLKKSWKVCHWVVQSQEPLAICGHYLKLNNVKIQVFRTTSQVLNAVTAGQEPPYWISGIPHPRNFSWALSVENQPYQEEAEAEGWARADLSVVESVFHTKQAEQPLKDCRHGNGKGHNWI